MPYNNNIPQSGETLGQTQLGINTNFAIIKTAQDVDHVPYDSANQGYHKQLHFNANQAAPGIGGGVSVAYVDTVGGVSALAFQNASGSFAITGKNPSVGANGYTTLPGGLLLQWGSDTAPSGTSGFFNFPTPFSVVPYSIVLTINRSSSSSASYDINVTSLSATQFKTNSGYSNSHTFYWMAIGLSP